MPSCVVKSCKNYTCKVNKAQEITYHSFPRNPIRRDEWVQIIRNCRKDNNWKPSSASTVCSVHFEEADLKTTAKGLRILSPYSVPKKLLSKTPENHTRAPSSFSITMEDSSIIKIEVEENELPSPSQNDINPLQVPAEKEQVLSESCRLCATSNCDGKLISLQTDDELQKLVVKMTNRLNTNIDFSLDHLPKKICAACVKALYTAYDFIVGIELTQINLNNRSTQNIKMPENGNHEDRLDLSTTPLQQVSSDTEAEESDYEQPSSPSSSTTISHVSPNIGQATNNKYEQPSSLESNLIIPTAPASPNKLQLKYEINKKKRVIEKQKSNIKRLNQRVRRLQSRNDALKNLIIKTVKRKI